MNSKTARKTLIGSFIGMMALTAASAATAGVAWFTTTRTANVSFHSASVSSNRGDLLVGELGAAPSKKAYAADDRTPAFDSEMDAISSYDGVTFYNALLDVDGSELGIYLEDEDPNVAEFGFSAGTQADAETELSIYLEKMDLKVTDVEAEDTDGDGSTKDFVIAGTPIADDVPVVKLNGVKQESGYTYNKENKTVTFTTAPRADNPETTEAVDPDVVTIEYRYEVAADDPILNSVRVALFASNEEDAVADIAVEANKTLVWDTTHGNTEKHYGITVTAKNANQSETHTIRKASEKFIDLKYVPENAAAITSIKLTRGTELVDEDLSSHITISGRRVNIDYDVKRGDVIAVEYKADTIARKELTNAATILDGYYAGKDLVDEYGGTPNTDGDLELYGAYLGETNSGDPLNVVVRAWIEGTDENHGNDEGSGWHPTDEQSIDITGHDYKVAFDLGLAAIDVNVA